MKKTSKVVKKKTSKKTNKVSLMIGIVVAILIVLGVGGYFLGNRVPLGGSFNASTKAEKIRVAGIKFPSPNNEVAVGYTLTLPVNIQPSNASNQKISCKSSNKKIAKVDADGTNCIVTGVATGTVTITATTRDNKNAIANSTVRVTNFKFESKNYTVAKGSSLTLMTEAINTTVNRTIKCTSSNTSIATATNSGTNCVVKGVKAGSVKITGTSNSGEIVTTNVTIQNQIKKESVKFATFNIGYFSGGSAKAGSGKAPEVIATWMKNNKIDIVGLQEARDQTKNTDPSNPKCKYSPSNIKTLAEGVTGVKKELKQFPNYLKISCSSNNMDAIISKRAFYTEHVQNIGYGRVLTRVVVNINGVNISFYNSHLGLDSKQNEKHFKKIAEIVKSDTNPVIITADWNNISRGMFEKYFVNSNMNFKIAAYDNSKNNMWNKQSYCDAILVNPKGHIDIGSAQVLAAYNVYSDHNMVAVTLSIY